MGHKSHKTKLSSEPSRRKKFIAIVISLCLFIAVLLVTIIFVTGVFNSNSDNSTKAPTKAPTFNSQLGDDNSEDDYGKPTDPPIAESSAYTNLEDSDYTGAEYGSGGASGFDDPMMFPGLVSTPTPEPTLQSGEVSKSVFHDELSAQFVKSVRIALPEQATAYPTKAPTNTPQPTTMPTFAPTNNTYLAPTSAPTSVMNISRGISYSIGLEQNESVLGRFVQELSNQPVSDFGRLYMTDMATLRLLIPEFKDRSFVLSTGDGTDTLISDTDFFELLREKLWKWSVHGFYLDKNGKASVQRIGVKWKYKKRPSCSKILKDLLRKAKKRDSSFQTIDSQFAFYAVFCFTEDTSTPLISLSKSSIPLLLQQIASKFQWTKSGLFQRTKLGEWAQWAAYGDALTVSGGSISEDAEVTVSGPEGFLPMQKHAFGWLGKQAFQVLVPNQVYRLRTLHENTLNLTSIYPSALVWTDLVYDTPIWFSFYKSTDVFGDSYEEQNKYTAHGNNTGFAYHIYTDQNLGSLRVGTFGKSFMHHSGLLFETIQSNDQFVDVLVTYNKAAQTTWIPSLSIAVNKKQAGSSKVISKTIVDISIEKNFNEPTTEPFSLHSTVRLDCGWANFTNSATEKFITVAPGLVKTGATTDSIDQKATSNTETYDVRVIADFYQKRALTEAEKKLYHPCTLHIGRFIQKTIAIPFS